MDIALSCPPPTEFTPALPSNLKAVLEAHRVIVLLQENRESLMRLSKIVDTNDHSLVYRRVNLAIKELSHAITELHK